MPGLGRGAWRNGRTHVALFVVQVVVTLTCAIRGLDYLRHDSDPSSVLSKVQDSAPLEVWGVLFIVAATTIVAGQLGRWGALVAAGHMVAMACYAAVALGLFSVTGLGPGVRTPIGLAGAAIIHAALGFDILAILRRREVSRDLSKAAG